MRQFDGFIKGVNLGGWISQCYEYSEEYYNTYITEENFKDIAEMGFDHVRIPIDYCVIETEEGEPIESGYKHIEDGIKWAKKYNLNILLDMHEVYGYSFDPLKDIDREIFFYDEALQERFLMLWETLAKRFGNDPDHVAFELLNEIVLGKVYDAWNKIVDKAVARIRAIAPKTYIVYGGVNYNNVTSVPMLTPPADDRIIYNFHCYDPLIFTHQSAYWVKGMPTDYHIAYPESLEVYRKESEPYEKECMGAIYTETLTSIGPEFFEILFAPAIETAEKYNVPLYCGEYGVIDRAARPDAKRWLDDIHAVFDKYGIGRAIWNYKGKDFEIMNSGFKF